MFRDNPVSLSRRSGVFCRPRGERRGSGIREGGRIRRKEGPSTVVTIEKVYASKLDNERRVFVYLPPGYAERPEERYPVLYMHAGQRAFAPMRPGTESWNIHLAADRLIGEGRMDPIIIVAVAHVRPVTANEYYHFKGPAEEMERLGCSGLAYEDFIVRELKPYIDSRFRTKTGPEHTALLGSSAGGLSTYHIGFRHPDVFGKLIMMSPYFVKAGLDESKPGTLVEEKLFREFEGKPPLKLWLDIGDAEGLFLPRHVRDVADGLLSRGYRSGEELAYLLQPEAAHQETDWGRRVHMPLLYMFGRPGRATSLELLGRNVVGLRGMSARINALIRYDSGLAVSELDGGYEVVDPSVLEVRRDGTIVPKRTGTTVVTLTARGLRASRTYTVIEELSEWVEVRLSADVPASTPADADIYGGMGMKLAPAGRRRYEGRFAVPRDTGYCFRFTRGFRKFEAPAAGAEDAAWRRSFRASDDIALHYTIERWEGLDSEAPEGRSYAASPEF